MPWTPEGDEEHRRGGKGRHGKRKERRKREERARETKPLIQWPGMQAWRKGFGLCSGPDPCLLD